MTEPSLPASSGTRDGPLPGRLGLWDAVSIIIGIVVGVTIFKVPPQVFGSTPGPWVALGLWLLGGVLSLLGGLCYAELATTYPQSGGNYVYLTRAYGRPIGFLYGWAHLVCLQPGNVGIMAYVFADYAAGLFGLASHHGVWLAAGAVVALAGLNMLGVVLGKATQNVLTLTKVAGLAAVLVAGFVWGSPAGFSPTGELPEPALGIALILILYAYGGWSDAAFVAAEVRDLRRNIPRALLLGTAAITGIYLLVNAAYLCGLGYSAAQSARAPAADVLGLMLGRGGAQAMSLIVMVSALGAVNGLLLTGSRVYASLGADHRLFSRLGRWNTRVDAPVWALAVQAAIAVGMILAVGTALGRARIDFGLAGLGLEPVPWSRFSDGFDTLLSATAPIFWSFFLLAGLSLFVLRLKDRGRERPFAVPLFPLVPAVFCLTSLYMLHASLAWAGRLVLLPVIPLVGAVPLYFLSELARRNGPAESPAGPEPPGR